MLAGIEQSKAKPFEKVLFALGIRHVGETVAKKLALHFKTIEQLSQATTEEIEAVPDMGGRIAQSVFDYLHTSEHQAQIQTLQNEGLQFAIVEKEIIRAGENLLGKTFLVSGVFEGYSREALVALIESHGGKMLSSISAKLNYLVAGDKMGPSKLAKADKLQVPIISEQELLQLINI